MSSGVSGPSVRWCVAKPHANEKVLQAVLDLFCGPGGVGCREIYLHAHASYALNAYYQMHGRNHWNCDFKGTGLVTFSDRMYDSIRLRDMPVTAMIKELKAVSFDYSIQIEKESGARAKLILLNIRAKSTIGREHERNHRIRMWDGGVDQTGNSKNLKHKASGIEISNATLHVQSANFSETDTCTDVDLKEVQLKRRAKGVVFSFICNSTSKED
ncbi:hypothetical protein NC652_015033 [Populus alba x Populus x berolinensis]|nr:hypothetical protein NC652_015033 [Populus alba x Populus x berolinensis]